MILGELDEASRTEEPAPAAAMQKTLDNSPDEIANGEDSCRHVVLSRHLAMPCSGRMGYPTALGALPDISADTGDAPAASHRRGTLCIPARALQLVH
jgi:hypothetical protein